MPQTLNTEMFYSAELAPSLKAVKGPVTSFELAKEMKDKWRTQAIEEGNLVGADFSNCPLFDEEKESKIRKEAKRAREIMGILAMADGEPSLEDKAALLHAEGELASGALVEGARRMRQEGEESSNRDLYIAEMERSQDILFGPLNPRLAAGCIAAWRKEITVADEDTTQLQLASFLDKYPWAVTLEGTLPKLSAEKSEAYHTALKEKFETDFHRLRDEMGEISNNTLVQAVNNYLRIRGYAGWECVSSDKQSGFVVKAALRQVVSGRRSKEITWERFEELMVHEVEDHLARAFNAEKAGAPAFTSASLPGVADIEEAWGIMSEGLWRGDRGGSPVERDVFRYAAVAYADGHYDGQYHTEDETFQFIKEMMRLKSVAAGVGLDMAEKKARTAAFDHTFRVYRGMPKGMVLRRNAAYLGGRTKVVDFIELTDADPREVIEYLQQGKFDPTNRRNTELLPLYKLKELPGYDDVT